MQQVFRKLSFSVVVLFVVVALSCGTSAQSALPDDLVERLEMLEQLKARGLIGADDYAARRSTLLNAIAPAAVKPSDPVGGTTLETDVPLARFDGTWAGIGLLEVNEEGRCPSIDIVLRIDGTEVMGTADGRLIGAHELAGEISEDGQLQVRTVQGAYNLALDGTLAKGNWSFTFCSGRFTLAHQGG